MQVLNRKGIVFTNQPMGLARLATYLGEKTGIKLSGEQIRRILLKKKYVYLWAKYSLEDKQDLSKRAAFKQKLEGYSKRQGS